MKKIIIVLALITIVYSVVNTKEEYVIVPKNSVRFRIIPNSNAPKDLYIKEQVKTSIDSVIKEIEKSKTINEARTSIKENINLVENKVSEVFKENNYNMDFKINYGTNYFPEKIYKGVKYEAGEYESMVVKIGSGSGDNYWCVLFPPLCLMEAEETDDVEYKFFIKEIIDKIF